MPETPRPGGGMLPFDTGSFRDRAGRVLIHEGRVLRALTEPARQAFQQLSGTKFFSRQVDAGSLVRTTPTEPPSLPVDFNGPKRQA